MTSEVLYAWIVLGPCTSPDISVDYVAYLFRIAGFQPIDYFKREEESATFIFIRFARYEAYGRLFGHSISVNGGKVSIPMIVRDTEVTPSINELQGQLVKMAEELQRLIRRIHGLERKLVHNKLPPLKGVQ